MPTVEKICVALSKDLAAVVRQAVESGEYASSSEVVRDALRDWKLKKALQQKQIDELRLLWNEGIKSGESRFSNMGEIIQEAQNRLHSTREDV